jgi:hypothetical protein
MRRKSPGLPRDEKFTKNALFDAPVPPWTFPLDNNVFSTSDLQYGSLGGMGLLADARQHSIDDLDPPTTTFKSTNLPCDPLRLATGFRAINRATHTSPLLSSTIGPSKVQHGIGQIHNQVETVQRCLEDGHDGGMIDKSLLDRLFLEDNVFRDKLDEYDPSVGNRLAVYENTNGKHVVRVGGFGWDDVYVQPIHPNGIVAGRPKFHTQSPVYDVACSFAPSSYIALRHASSISYIVPRHVTVDEVYDSESEEEPPLFVDLVGTQNVQSGILSCKWNPIMTDEILSLTDNGKLILATLKRPIGRIVDQRVVANMSWNYMGKPPISVFERWGDVVFAQHPRLVITATRDRINRVDLRKVQREVSWNRSLLKLQRETCSALAFGDPYIAIATDSQVILLDHRMPGQRLLSWNHSFGTHRRNRITQLSILSNNGVGEVLAATRRHDYFEVLPFEPATDKCPPVAPARPYRLDSAISFLHNPGGQSGTLLGQGLAVDELASHVDLMQLTSDGIVHVGQAKRGVFLVQQDVAHDEDVAMDRLGQTPLGKLLNHELLARKRPSNNLELASAPIVNHSRTLWQLAPIQSIQYGREGVTSLGGKHVASILRTDILEDYGRLADEGGEKKIDLSTAWIPTDMAQQVKIDATRLDVARDELQAVYQEQFQDKEIVKDLVAASIVIFPHDEGQFGIAPPKLSKEAKELLDTWDVPKTHYNFPPLRPPRSKAKKQKHTKIETAKLKQHQEEDEDNLRIESALASSNATETLQYRGRRPDFPRPDSQLSQSTTPLVRARSSQPSQGSQKKARKSGF